MSTFYVEYPVGTELFRATLNQEQFNNLKNNKYKMNGHLTPEQLQLLFKLRKVSNKTLYGKAISDAAYSCYDQKGFNKIVTELKGASTDGPKVMEDILGNELLTEIQGYETELL